MTDLTKINVNKLVILTFYNAKARSSFCWKYFGSLIFCDANKKKTLNPDQVYCSACLSAIQEENGDVNFGSVKVKNYNKTVSTGNLTRHLRDIHHIRDESASIDKSRSKIKEIFSAPRYAKTSASSSSKPQITKYDKGLLARDVALWFCKSLLPFDSVSDEGMIDFFKKYAIIVTEDQLPSRCTVLGSALSDVYECMLYNIKEKISVDASQHFAMTFDLWTDQYRQLNYITITLHYLTNDFELKAMNLTTQILTEKKIVKRIEGVIKDVKNQFELENKVVHAVTDAGENVRQAVLLANMTQHLCLGLGLHNLITVDGINTVHETASLVKKCKKIVKAIRCRLPDLEVDAEKLQRELLGSLDKVAQMLECDESNPIFQNDLSENQEGNEEANTLASTSKEINYIATPSRWHSILEMLESLIYACNQDLINKMLKKIGKNELKITQSEWTILGDLVNFLKRFREVIEIMSSQSTCTMNVALVFRSEIIDILNSVLDDESVIMLSLKRNMLENIGKRFPVTKVMVATALLDTRFMGLTEVDSYLETHRMSRASFLASYVKEIIKTDDICNTTLNVTETSATASTSRTPTFLQKLSMKHSVGATQGMPDDPVDQECWRYLASADPTEPKDGNLLSFWNDKKKTFPWLSALAKSLLCVPATSMPSERVFSAAGLELSAKRLRLNPTRVHKIIFIHDNYKTCKTVDSEEH